MKLPIVELFFDAEQGEYNDETGTKRLYYADERLHEYRAVDNPHDRVSEYEVGCSMQDIIRAYRVDREDQ